MVESVQKSANASCPRVDTLDGFRAIAALLVLVFHLALQNKFDFNFRLGRLVVPLEYLPLTGFIGVELFFFISGFCLYYPYARAVRFKEPWPTLKQFFLRRAFKIFPSYLFAVVIAISFLDPKPWPVQGLKHLLSHLTFTHGFFRGTQGSLMDVLWTLSIEVQFYLLFPAIALAYRRWSWQVLSLSLIVGATYRAWILNKYPTELVFYFRQLPTFIELFIGGMAASHLHVALQSEKERSREIFAKMAKPVFLCATLVLNFLLYDLYLVRYHFKSGHTERRMQHEGLVTVCFFALVATAPYVWPRVRRLLANRIMFFFSTISYNLYLWHQTVGRLLLEHRIPSPTTSAPHDDPVWRVKHLCLAVAGSVLLAMLLTSVLELPLIRWAARWTRKRANLSGTNASVKTIRKVA